MRYAISLTFILVFIGLIFSIENASAASMKKLTIRIASENTPINFNLQKNGNPIVTNKEISPRSGQYDVPVNQEVGKKTNYILTFIDPRQINDIICTVKFNMTYQSRKIKGTVTSSNPCKYMSTPVEAADETVFIVESAN